MAMNRRDIPNIISIMRIMICIPIVWTLLQQRFGLALVLFLVAGISDGLDGFLAKQFRWESHLGGILDPVADKLLLLSSMLSLGWMGMLPWWLVAVVVLRDVIIVAGATIYYFHINRVDAQPSMISKINTVVQIILVVAVVMDVGLIGLPSLLLQGLIWGTLVTTILSGVDYVCVWGRRAAESRSS
jgi:cardiolipin synthase